MSFFYEFPHTHTYDTDLAWLIKRMREVLARMDTVEEKMAALEKLVTDFVNEANIPQLIKDALQDLVDRGEMDYIIATVLSYDSGYITGDNFVDKAYFYGYSTSVGEGIAEQEIVRQNLRIRVLGTTAHLNGGAFQESGGVAVFSNKETSRNTGIVLTNTDRASQAFFTLNVENMNAAIQTVAPNLEIALPPATKEELTIQTSWSEVSTAWVNNESDYYLSRQTASLCLNERFGLYIRGFFNSTTFAGNTGSDYPAQESPKALWFHGFTMELPLKEKK